VNRSAQGIPLIRSLAGKSLVSAVCLDAETEAENGEGEDVVNPDSVGSDLVATGNDAPADTE